MTTGIGILVKCNGPCGQDVAAAECDTQGRCALCVVMYEVADDYREYKRLWSKRKRYAEKGIDVKQIESQLGRVVGRVAQACHKKLPVGGAVKLTNEICENARAEVDGYSRILTVRQARVGKPKESQRKGTPERRSPGGVYLPGR